MKTLFFIILFLTFPLSLNGSSKAFAQEPIYIAIVIDDFGNPYDDVEEMIALDIPITGAVIPGLPNSVQQMYSLKENGHGVMIHMPIESRGSRKGWDTDLALKACLSKEEIISRLETAIAELSLATAINNHMGSIGTANRDLMEIFVAKAKEHDLIVLDSITTSKTKIGEVAEEQNADFLKRDVFLDDKHGTGHVHKSFLEALEIAKKNGFAIVIGHVGPAGHCGTTVQGIKNMITQLKGEGVTFVTIDELYKLKKYAD